MKAIFPLEFRNPVRLSLLTGPFALIAPSIFPILFPRELQLRRRTSCYRCGSAETRARRGRRNHLALGHMNTLIEMP
jgi:hypothetical protein